MYQKCQISTFLGQNHSFCKQLQHSLELYIAFPLPATRMAKIGLALLAYVASLLAYEITNGLPNGSGTNAKK